MKLISIGTDRKILEEGSAVRQRNIEYGELFEELHIIVFGINQKSKVKRQKISDNVWVYSTNSKNKLAYLLDAYRLAKNIIREIGKEGVVVTTQDPFETGLVGLLLKLVYKLPLNVQIHTDFANRYFILHSLLNTIRFAIGEVVLSFADSVRVVSERVKRSVHNDPELISVLSIWVEKPKVQSPKPKPNTDKIKFLSIARLEREKDLGTAIRALKKVLDTGVDAELVIVGDGSEGVSLERLARELNIEKRVTFAGWRSDLSKFYAEADAYISTSLYEGYGMSMVEAAFYGLPLVISDTGVAGELFTYGKEAIICKRGDVEDFSQAMRLLARNIELRYKMGSLARQAVEGSYITKEQYLNKWREAMEFAVRGARLSFFKKNILARYLVAGITAASSNIVLLYVFTDILDIWYLFSSTLSFIIGITLSFILQKFWTFGDRQVEGAHYQFSKYLGVGILGIMINTTSMYIMVDWLDIWYILAQIITGVFIAVFNFIMYKFLIFKK